jgi:hypothetical protein
MRAPRLGAPPGHGGVNYLYESFAIDPPLGANRHTSED